MSPTAEDIIHEWIDSKCDPPPRSSRENLRRTMREFVRAWDSLKKKHPIIQKLIDEQEES